MFCRYEQCSEAKLKSTLEYSAGNRSVGLGSINLTEAVFPVNLCTWSLSALCCAASPKNLEELDLAMTRRMLALVLKL